ncbi:hypothetical protein Tco_0224140, partial [Tanacetum coccineum]
MSQPANDEFSQHLSDDEESNHEDASDTGAAPKQKQQVIPQTTAISNIKLPIMKNDEYDILAMEMEHYLEYIDNDVWNVIQNENSKKRISTERSISFRILSIQSLPPAWSNLAMTMRTKPDVDTLSIDDLYNNLRVFEQEIQGASKTSSSAQNVAFVSQSKSSTNKQEAEKQEKNQIGLLTMDDGIVNWREHTEVEETNHALMAISSSNEANEIYEKDEKLKRYRIIGMKTVKEKEQLQKTLDSWKDSSKNLWRLINYGMSSNSKVGLGFEIQSNNEVLSYEEEMNFSVFNCSKEDSVGKPLYSRFTKTNDFKGVPLIFLWCFFDFALLRNK